MFKQGDITLQGKGFPIVAFSRQEQRRIINNSSSILQQQDHLSTCCGVSGNLVLEGQSDEQCSSCSS